MFIDQLTAHTTNSEMIITGSVKNLFSLADENDQKPILDCSITSPKLNLNDFIPFLHRKKTTIQKKKRKTVFAKTVSKIMGVVNDAEVHLQLKAKQLTYRKFFAINVSAGVLLSNDKVELNNVILGHAGGTLTLNGALFNNADNNTVQLKSRMREMDINKLFLAFDNFGQTAITDKNLRGKLDADIIMTGMISEKAELIPNSLKGIIDFSITDGELIQFEPVEKISQVAFKERDFSDIHFAELKDKLDVDGTKITVNRMEIHSNVLNMFVEGTHDLKKGTDMSIQIPLSNLKEKDLKIEPTNRGIKSKTGVSVRLRAKTGDDGKLKITWDPFKKALKTKKKIS
jgi:hypothetical protein